MRKSRLTELMTYGNLHSLPAPKFHCHNRPNVVTSYNQHATAGSLLVEVGAAGNSLDEALLAARLFAEGFAEVIGGEK